MAPTIGILLIEFRACLASLMERIDLEILERLNFDFHCNEYVSAGRFHGDLFWSCADRRPCCIQRGQQLFGKQKEGRKIVQNY